MQLDPFSFLETTAEIAITFAGFFSVFLALDRRDQAVPSAVALSIRLVLLSGVFCTFFSALPILLATSGLLGAMLWRVCSVPFLIFHLGVSAFVGRELRRYSDPGRTRYVAAGYVLSALSALLPLSNLLGWPLAPNGGLYLASIWLVLGIGVTNFFGLVFHRMANPGRR